LEGVDWIDLALYTCKWQDLVNEAMSLRGKEQQEVHFLTGGELFILSKKTQLHAVS